MLYVLVIFIFVEKIPISQFPDGLGHVSIWLILMTFSS